MGYKYLGTFYQSFRRLEYLTPCPRESAPKRRKNSRTGTHVLPGYDSLPVSVITHSRARGESIILIYLWYYTYMCEKDTLPSWDWCPTRVCWNAKVQVRESKYVGSSENSHICITMNISRIVELYITLYHL